MGIVLWKPLYFMSIVLFVISVALFPINTTWSILTIFALVTLWSRIPGFIHFVFNKLALNDLFSFLIMMNLGGLAGGIFGAFSMLFSRIVGPDEWWPFTMRYSAAIFFAGMISPYIINTVGVDGMAAYFWYEGTLYAIYYILVLLFARDEIPLEIGLLPAVFFFDFVMNAAIVRIFGNTISNILVNGLSSAWPIIFFSGLILGFFVMARNGKTIAAKIEPYWNKIFVWKKDVPKQAAQKELTWDDVPASQVPTSLAPKKVEMAEKQANVQPPQDVVEEKIHQFESQKQKKKRGFLSTLLGKIGE